MDAAKLERRDRVRQDARNQPEAIPADFSTTGEVSSARCSARSPRAAPPPTASSFATATSSPSSATSTRPIRPTQWRRACSSTVAGIAVRDGLIKDLDAPVGSQIKDGGYDSPQNAKVTWRHHLQQDSEWEGEMWGKKHDFVGTVAFGDGERKPRALQAPGTLLRIQRRPHQSLLALAAAPVQEAGARCVPRRSDERHRRVEHVAVDSLQEQLRRRRRQEARRR